MSQTRIPSVAFRDGHTVTVGSGERGNFSSPAMSEQRCGVKSRGGQPDAIFRPAYARVKVGVEFEKRKWISLSGDSTSARR